MHSGNLDFKVIKRKGKNFGSELKIFNMCFSQGLDSS